MGFQLPKCANELKKLKRMDKLFVFVVPLTPEKLRSSLRYDLMQVTVNALKAQQYDNWRALLIGEEEREEGQLTYLKSAKSWKNDKLDMAYDYIQKMDPKPDYLIRLDDDDVIHPEQLQIASELDFDVYGDQYHAFYDMISGKTSLQLRPWLPNTVIHKLEHAFTPTDPEGNPLFMNDHSKWHEYYRDKNVQHTKKDKPVYLRILSPSTVTANRGKDNVTATLEYDEHAYKKYLKGFGKWRNKSIEGVETAIDQLRDIRIRHYGEFPKPGLLEKLLG